jgi:uncharacterized protein YjbI with pentapeptide repeats
MKHPLFLKKILPWVPISTIAGLILAVSLGIWQIPIIEVNNLSNEEISQERERTELENAKRDNLLKAIQGAGALAFIVAAWFSYQTLRRTEEKQSSERFCKAVEMLGNRENLDVRLGGIYALEQLAKDSPQNYHWLIIEVLSSFLQVYNSFAKNQVNENLSKRSSEKMPRDSRTALASIKRLREKNIAFERPFTQIDLTATNWKEYNLNFHNLERFLLENANLNKISAFQANFHCSVLKGAQIRQAFLSEADLSNADLDEADLEEANLYRANLQEAGLENAILIKSYLARANLYRAHLENANLSNANLRGANLTYAKLSGANLNGAKLTNYLSDYVSTSTIYNSSESSSNSNLDHADFSQAKLQHADLSYTTMREANFEGTDLQGTIFKGSELKNANFRGADVKGAEFFKTNLKLEQIIVARNYQDIKCDDDFSKKLKKYASQVMNSQNIQSSSQYGSTK